MKAVPQRARTLLLAIATTALVAGCATGGMSPGIDYRGGVLTDKEGMTLYTYIKDPFQKSVCTGPCETNWPPVKAGPNDHGGGDFVIITRDDGSKQWAFEGKPLYRWIKDSKPGDKTGQGFNNAWSTVNEPPTKKVVSDY